MSQPIVFFDLAGPDDAALRDFYREIFGWAFSDSSQCSVPVHAPIQGAVRRDPQEKRIYVGVPDVAATLERIVERGGTIDTPRFEVPGQVVLGLFRDPAGNAMGLVELDGGKVRIP